MPQNVSSGVTAFANDMSDPSGNCQKQTVPSLLALARQLAVGAKLKVTT
jgi:hypothetical protein